MKTRSIGSLVQFLNSFGLHVSASAKILGGSVNGIVSDSRKLAQGVLFVATRGESSDGHRFVGEALQKFGCLVLGEAPPNEVCGNHPNYIWVNDSKRALGLASSWWHGFPSRKLTVVGITGTAGKTTSSFLVESIFKQAGFKTALIGTVAFKIGDQEIPSTHTTPGAPELQEFLAKAVEQGCTHLVMEVSSHALKQRRVDGLFFDGMVFTNLSPEHLDYHSGIEDYFVSKQRLFTAIAMDSRKIGKNPAAWIQPGSEFSNRLLRENSCRVIGAESSKITLESNASGIDGSLNGVEFHSELLGKFNCENILGAAAICKELGIDSGFIAKGIASARVPGRLEPVENSAGIHCIVDYAHKIEALEKVLSTLFELPGRGRLITVFGCGGDRDKLKRPVMGEIATRFSDHTWVTSDNPRTEDPNQIIQEITSGIPAGRNFSVCPDRREAIGLALGEAKRGDIVLIAGKGHETYQIIGDKKLPFDDRQVAREALTLVLKNQ